VHRFEKAEDWAKEFDDPARDAWQKPAEVVGLMKIAPGMTVADIGAGTGYFEPHLSRAVGASGKVLALDVEPDMVRYLGERVKREKLANVEARTAQLADPGLGKASVDRVLIVDTWHHIDARPAYAAKLLEGLKPGGLVVIVDFTMEAQHGPPKEHRVPPEKVAAELKAAGLSTQIATETLPEQYVVIGARGPT
jgi:predicted methyltransferase